MGDMELIHNLFNTREYLIKEFNLEKTNILESVILNDTLVLLLHKKKNSNLLFASVRHLSCGRIVERTLCSFGDRDCKRLLFERDYIVVLLKDKKRYKVETIYDINEQQHMDMKSISRYKNEKNRCYNRPNFIECEGPDTSGIGSYTLKKVLK